MGNPTEYKNISIYFKFFLNIVPLTSPDLPLCTENVSRLVLKNTSVEKIKIHHWLFKYVALYWVD